MGVRAVSGLSRSKCHRQQTGFGYLAALLVIALLGVALAAAGEMWQINRQREQERELLFVGEQFRAAIGRYYKKSPSGAKHFPLHLDDLLEDPRYPNPVRHLRKLYRDPLTGKDEWGLVTVANGEIVGVYSLSQKTPLKTAHFSPTQQEFVGATHYADWKFVYNPKPPGK